MKQFGKKHFFMGSPLFYLLLMSVISIFFVLDVSAQEAWTQIGMSIEGEAVGDRSACSISLSSDGMRVAIGAYLSDGNGEDSGHTRIYEYSKGSWVQMGTDIDGETTNDQSGYSVSLSADGTRVAIGAYYNDGNGGNSGHTRIYEYSEGTWVQIGEDVDGKAAYDWSGYSVSLSADGSRVAIGSYFNSGNGANSGHARIFECSEGTWVQIGEDIDGEAKGDRSGCSVSLNGDGSRIAIGAIYNSDNGLQSGHTRIFEYVEGAWIQMGADIDGEAASDWSGCAVSLSTNGTRVAIGAFANDGNGSLSGHTRMFEYIGGDWVQMGSDIDGEAKGDQSGRAVSLSADGLRVAIGAYANSENGYWSGHARIFEYSEDAWVQKGADIDGESAKDMSGWSISLSADGERVAVGALYNVGDEEKLGHVRVWRWKKDSDNMRKILGGILAVVFAGFMVKLSIDHRKK